MAEKLDGELRRRLGQLSDSGTLAPVIVTLKPGARAADVIPGRIEHDFPAISAVSCKLTAQQVLELSNHPSVERIEYDGEVRAL